MKVNKNKWNIIDNEDAQIFEIFEYKLKIIFGKEVFKIHYIFYWKIFFFFRKKSLYIFYILFKYYTYHTHLIFLNFLNLNEISINSLRYQWIRSSKVSLISLQTRNIHIRPSCSDIEFSDTCFNQVRNPGTVAGPNAKCNRIVSTGRIMAIARIEFGARASIKDRPKYCGVTTNALVRELTPCYVQQHPGFNTPSHFFPSYLPFFHHLHRYFLLPALYQTSFFFVFHGTFRAPPLCLDMLAWS